MSTATSVEQDLQQDLQQDTQQDLQQNLQQDTQQDLQQSMKANHYESKQDVELKQDVEVMQPPTAAVDHSAPKLDSYGRTIALDVMCALAKNQAGEYINIYTGKKIDMSEYYGTSDPDWARHQVEDVRDV